MAQESLLDNPEFLEFMIAAKKNTYASGSDAKAEVLPDGGKRYQFYSETRWPLWRYEDIYYGFNPFFGREFYYESINGLWIPIAHMPYGGFAKGTEDEVKRVFAFLEKMLQQVSMQSLFRGRTEHVREDGLQYHCQWVRKDPFRTGGTESIMEYILRQGEPLHYQLNFQFCCLR